MPNKRTEACLTASGTTCSEITYALYVGFRLKPCLSCYTALWCAYLVYDLAVFNACQLIYA